MGSTKRIFIGFAVEDEDGRNLLRGQSRLGDCPIEYTDYSVKEAWTSDWKTKCRSRIKGCDGFIAPFLTRRREAMGAAGGLMAGATARSLSGLSLGGRSGAGNRGGGRVVNNYHSLDGAILGKGAAAEIMAIIGGDVTKLVDGRVRSARMGEAR